MKKMLIRVSRILNIKGAKFLRVTQNEIDEVLANNIGDIRSALLNLIFCSLKGQFSINSALNKITQTKIKY